MNKFEIKKTDENMYEYRGYTISGNDRTSYVCTSPYGAFSPKAYSTIDDAMTAIDDDIACIAEKTATSKQRWNKIRPQWNI